ncbi:MAG: hypothetical protein VB013_06265 [Anaerolineaceae bacterium]|nr:hypothetical protein [Anaerolineaceae bacterium]
MTDSYQPDEIVLRSIRQRMQVRDTEELLKIYADHDTESWIPATFNIIRAILLERGVDTTHLTDMTAISEPFHLAKIDPDHSGITLKLSPALASQIKKIQRSIVYEEMKQKDEDELLTILAERDAELWTPITFEVVRSILLERGFSREELNSLQPGMFNETDVEQTDPELESIDPTLKITIRQAMGVKETEELLGILEQHDTETWIPETFTIVKQLLHERDISDEEIELEGKRSRNVPGILSKDSLADLSQLFTVPPARESILVTSLRQKLAQAEDDMLLQIYNQQGSQKWLPVTFEIVLSILHERGWQDAQIHEYLAGIADQPDEDEEVEYLDFSNIDWQNDSVEVIYRTLAKLENISELSYFSNDENDPIALMAEGPESFECTFCGNQIPWSAEICPICGIDLYPGHNLADFLEVKEEPIESEVEEFAAELREMSKDELREMWFDLDPMDWSRSELQAIRLVFAEKDVHVPYLLDAPADLAQRLPYLTQDALNFRGEFGYRLRPGRSGLDYIDTAAELNRFTGVLIRWVIDAIKRELLFWV